jgi:hypothetical protein
MRKNRHSGKSNLLLYPLIKSVIERYVVMLPSTLLLYLLMKRAIKRTVVILKEYQCYQKTDKIVFNNLASRLIPNTDEIIGTYQNGFRRNKSNADQIYCISQIQEKKREYNEGAHQSFVDFEKTYDIV